MKSKAFDRSGRTAGMFFAFVILFQGSTFLCGGQERPKEIVGYYPSWKWAVMAPSQIPFEKLTCINYAFFRPLPDGSVVGRDSIGDRYILGSGGPSAASETLVPLAHRHQVKVLLSIGGWADSDNFSSVAASAQSREQFAHSCVDQIRKFGFDGIDLDWEYPGYAEHNGTEADRPNFTLLVRTLRDSLDRCERERSARLILTAAMPAFESALVHYELDSLATLFEALNIMTYDFIGSWSPLSGHNAPLYKAAGGDSLLTVDAAFMLYTGRFHVPAGMINLGAPFYGHTYADCSSLFSSHAGADTVHFSGDGAFYSQIAPLVKNNRRVWDDRAKVPYLVCESWNTLVSYDDSQSVSEKARYVLGHKARGMIIWEITGDFMDDGTSPLLDAVYAGLRKEQWDTKRK